jgi:hypothetical protein
VAVAVTATAAILRLSKNGSGKRQTGFHCITAGRIRQTALGRVVYLFLRKLIGAYALRLNCERETTLSLSEGRFERLLASGAAKIAPGRA